VPYLRERLREDPHVWATALYNEITALGFGLSYQSLTRGLRRHELRPPCEACAGVKGQPRTSQVDRVVTAPSRQPSSQGASHWVDHHFLCPRS